MTTKIFKYIILGAPASGKGTLSSRIVNKFKLEHISSGDKLRLHIQKKSDIGIKAQQFMNEGKLVPDSFMVDFILKEIKNVQTGSWLLDGKHILKNFYEPNVLGFPRTLPQAQKLNEVEKIDLVLNLDVPFDVIINRAKNRWIHLPSGRVYNLEFNAPKIAGKDDITGETLIQRDDDKLELVRQRLQDYQKLTTPLIAFYRDIGILEQFKGRTSNEIWLKLDTFLTKFMSK